MHVFRRKIRVVPIDRIGGDFAACALGHGCGGGIVEIDNRLTGLLEKLVLGRQIVFKGTVVIEMILREIGKQRDIKMHPCYPLLCQRLGGDLHHAVRTARFYHLVEKLIEFVWVRGRQLRREHLVPHHILHRADQPRLIPRSIQDLLDQEGGGRLPVGACDPDQMKLFRRIFKKRFTHQRIRGPGIWHEHLARNPRVIFRNDRSGTGLDRFRRCRVSVEILSSDADKRASGPNLPGIVGDERNFRVSARQSRCNPLQQF